MKMSCKSLASKLSWERLHRLREELMEVTDSDEMSEEVLRAIRARLDEPPPLIALAERHRGGTALFEYLTRLQQDRIALVDEVDRLRRTLEED
jgi:hypothetical protein